MIRKVPNHKAWVLEKGHIIILYKTIKVNWNIIVNLPLFDLRVDPVAYHKSSTHIVCIDSSELEITDEGLYISFDLLEAINKTWNKFYD